MIDQNNKDEITTLNFVFFRNIFLGWCFFVPYGALVTYFSNMSLPDDQFYFAMKFSMALVLVFSTLIVGISQIMLGKLKRNENELEKIAYVDCLTGVFMRKPFLDRICIDVSDDKLSQTMSPGWLVMVDADHFKKINDTYGHDLGDRVLVMIADTLVKAAGPDAIVGRLGGEEFAIYKKSGTMSDAQAVVGKIQRRLSKNLIEFKSNWINVTLSGGMYVFNEKTEIHHALRKADQMLYSAKDGGRNKILIETSQREAKFSRVSEVNHAFNRVATLPHAL